MDAIKDCGGDLSSEEFDLDAVVATFRSKASALHAMRANDVEKITASLQKFYGQNPKATANVPALQSIVMRDLWDGNTATFGLLNDRVHEVIASSPDIIVERGPGKGARLRSSEEREFYLANGRDRSPEELKALREEQKKTAKK